MSGHRAVLAACLLVWSVAAVPGRADDDPHEGPADLKKAMEDPAITGLCCMQGGFCGPTSWRMNFAFYGKRVDASVLYNLGWNYGFEYDVTPGGAVAWPTTYPQEQTEHAARMLGFKMDKKVFPMNPTRDRSDQKREAALVEACRKSATRKMIEAIDQGKPVIVHWTPHLVLAYGHEGDKILFHDPLDTTVSAEELEGYRALGIGKGSCRKEKTQAWTEGIRSWQEMGCPIYVVEPDPKSGRTPENIPWKEIWERNAQRTLGIKGKGGNVTPGSPAQLFGVPAIRKFAKAIESIFPTEPERYGEWGHLGFTARANAAEFLKKKAKEAERAGDEPLRKALKTAAVAFAVSADLFHQAKVLVESALKPGADRKAIAAQLKAKLLAIADVETEAAAALMAAAGKPMPAK